MPTAIDQEKWQQVNNRYVQAAVAWVRALLTEHVPQSPAAVVRKTKRRRGLLAWLFGEVTEEVVEAPSPALPAASPSAHEAAQEIKNIEAELVSLGTVSSLHQLAMRFDLTAFEKNVLLLCLAFELQTHIGWLCGLIQDRPQRPFPTFGLAVSIFADAEWQAMAPDRPLRRCRLIELRQPAGTPLHAADLRLEETVLHYLRALPSLDARLNSFVHQVPLPDAIENAQQQELVERIANALSPVQQRRPLIQMIGGNAIEAQRVAGAVCRSQHWKMFQCPVECLPASPADSEEFAHLWQRDSTLFGLALLLDVGDSAASGEVQRSSGLLRFVAHVHSPLFLVTRERLHLPGIKEMSLEISGPSADAQAEMWLQQLPKGLPQPEQFAGELSRQFTIDEALAKDAIAVVMQQPQGKSAAHFPRLLWKECRLRSRPRLEGLAQRIDVKATKADLILSDDRHATLRQIQGQVRSRWRVYDKWGWSLRMNRGLGISALFCGESGTGKTMAAEVLANELDLDLYRVDLSSVVNKYIGETEKHLRRLFDAFESCGAILFFDECDALFGKRSEVKDSHDRYANIEINYLLQRLESYRGLAILATNHRDALDTAFFRRLRFVITFPMPSADERQRIWKRLLPPESESKEAQEKPRIPVDVLDYGRLAEFHFSGGNIHNVVVNASFRAASRDKDQRVTMRDVLAASRDEYVKLERPFDDADFLPDESLLKEALL